MLAEKGQPNQYEIENNDNSGNDTNRNRRQNMINALSHDLLARRNHCKWHKSKWNTK